MAIIKVKIYPYLEKTIPVEVNTTVVKEVLEILKNSLKLQGQYAIVKSGRILDTNEYINENDEIVLVPIVEGG